MPGLSLDDRHLLAALRARGLDATPVVWEDRYVDCQSNDLILVRSVWDYAYRWRQFLAWTRAMANLTRFHNSAEIIGWNLHKRYLNDLGAREVAVVPTLVFEPPDQVELDQVISAQGWDDAILKPAIGAAGRWVTRFRAGEGALTAERARHLLNHEDVLLQPFLPGVLERGELSVVFIDGEPTHAVRKRAASADELRVHDDFGGLVEPVEPTVDEEQLARAAMAAVEGEPLYGRVDIIEGPERQPLVSELELIEPELFFRFSQPAVDRMCDALERLCSRQEPGAGP
jgi:glutathione synthase/RimK-type ligase-like ATP-grasp enzyme